MLGDGDGMDGYEGGWEMYGCMIRNGMREDGVGAFRKAWLLSPETLIRMILETGNLALRMCNRREMLCLLFTCECCNYLPFA